MTDIKKLCDDATRLIESCWDCNQELDENGKPVDGLTFDERLDKKRKELKDKELGFIIDESRR